MKLDEALQPLSRTTLADEIFERLLGLINSKELPPGEKLPPERELSDRLGVGRSSVREALRALTMIGLLDARPGDGTFVTESPVGGVISPFVLHERVTRENAMEIIEVRLFLETKLAALAAEKANEEEKDLVRQCFEDIVARKDDLGSYFKADWGFHEAVAQAAHNSYLFQMFLMIRYLVLGWFAQPLNIDMGRGLQEHKRTLDAIMAGDADAASKAMQYHVERSGKLLLETFTPNRAGGFR